MIKVGFTCLSWINFQKQVSLINLNTQARRSLSLTGAWVFMTGHWVADGTQRIHVPTEGCAGIPIGEKSADLAEAMEESASMQSLKVSGCQLTARHWSHLAHALCSIDRKSFFSLDVSCKCDDDMPTPLPRPPHRCCHFAQTTISVMAV